MTVRNLLVLSRVLKNSGMHTSFTILIIITFNGLGRRKNRKKDLRYIVTLILGMYRVNKYYKDYEEFDIGIIEKRL